jgi:hypothetical protein
MMAGGGDGFEVVVGFVQLIRRRNRCLKVAQWQSANSVKL